MIATKIWRRNTGAVRVSHKAKGKKAKAPEMITLYLQGTPNLKVILPLEEARLHLGVHGYHVRMVPPLRALFVIGGMILFASTLGYYSYFFYHGLSKVLLWGTIGLVVGGLPGLLLGGMIKKSWTKHIYTAWTSWDEKAKKRTITPMDHQSAMDLMEDPTPEHRLAILARVGELPMKQKRPWPGPGSQGMKEPEMEPDINSAATEHVVAGYSPRGLYTVMQGVIYQRVLSVRRKTDRVVQMISLGTIAVAMIVIAALVVLVFTSKDGGEEVPGPTAPSAYEGVSDAKR